jgi:hypothetical protein
MGDVSEAFLPRSVPYLQFNLGGVDLHGFEFEVDPDGGHVAFLEDVITEFGDQVGFADSAVSYYDDF